MTAKAVILTNTSEAELWKKIAVEKKNELLQGATYICIRPLLAATFQTFSAGCRQTQNPNHDKLKLFLFPVVSRFLIFHQPNLYQL